MFMGIVIEERKLYKFLNIKKKKKKLSSYLQRYSTNFFRAAQSVHLEVEKCATENRDWNFQRSEI